MRDLAGTLINETMNDTSMIDATMIDQDVQDMFEFEKNIAKVRFCL